jgi:hypothetical protein
MSKMCYSDVANALRDMSDASMEARGGYGYAMGVCENMLATLIAELPAHRQKEYMRVVADVTATLKKEVSE